jgi:hypothetical protein
MATFTIRHEIDCTPEKFWKLFFDADLQKQIFSELQFPKWEVVAQQETETEIVRVVKAIPKLDAPAAVTKVLGPGFGYTEEGRFDKAAKVYRFVVKPTALADKLKNEGTVRCEPSGMDKCMRIVEAVAEAKIFGIGGMLEKMTEKGMRDGWEKGAQLFNARIKSGG